MNTTGKVLTGMVIGLGVGATLGLLFAPHKGKKTREMLVDRGNDIKHDLKDKVAKSNEKISELKEGIAQALMEKVDKLSNAIAHEFN